MFPDGGVPAGEPGEEERGGLPVARVEFAEGRRMSWRELFEGYTRVSVITFSSSLGFLRRLLALIPDAEVIFGNPRVMPCDIAEIMAFQKATEEEIRASRSREFFIKRLREGTLRLYAARADLSHEKLYLLSSDDGRRRVITGSANMSGRAFSGAQRENIVYMDGEEGYDWYREVFDAYLRECADEITEKAVLASDEGDGIDSIPIVGTVNAARVLEIAPSDAGREEIEFALKVDVLGQRYRRVAPREEKKGGPLLINPGFIKRMRQNAERVRADESAARQEYPLLRVDTEARVVTLDGEVLDLNPPPGDVASDVDLFLRFMDGYRDFCGDWEDMQKRYYAFANWFFCSPFCPAMRRAASLYDADRSFYPVFGVLYGQSKAGKTTFLKMLLQMMIGQAPIIAGKDFTAGRGDALRARVEGVPIVVDDIERTRFSQNAPELIKNDDFGYANDLRYFPAIVFSANTGLESVKTELSRRSVCVNVSAGLPNERLGGMSAKVARIKRRMGTAFYREYLRRMLDGVPSLIDALKSDEGEIEAPDILNISSVVLLSIMSEHCGSLPDYARELCYGDYFGSSVLGKNAREKVLRAWRNNPRSFTVRRRLNELVYDTGDHYEPGRLRDELPENLEVKVTQSQIVMKLDEARKFFGVGFRRAPFRGK